VGPEKQKLDTENEGITILQRAVNRLSNDKA
jgi:hypothetical protein